MFYLGNHVRLRCNEILKNFFFFFLPLTLVTNKYLVVNLKERVSHSRSKNKNKNRALGWRENCCNMIKGEHCSVANRRVFWVGNKSACLAGLFPILSGVLPVLWVAFRVGKPSKKGWRSRAILWDPLWRVPVKNPRAAFCSLWVPLIWPPPKANYSLDGRVGGCGAQGGGSGLCPPFFQREKGAKGQNSWAQERKPKGHKTWLPQTQPLASSILPAFVVLAFCLFVCFYFGVCVCVLSFFPLLVFVWLEKVRAERGRKRNDRSVSLRRPTVRTGRAYSKQRPPASCQLYNLRVGSLELQGCLGCVWPWQGDCRGKGP